MVVYLPRSAANGLISTMQDLALGNVTVEAKDAEAARGLAGRRVVAADDKYRYADRLRRGGGGFAEGGPAVRKKLDAADEADGGASEEVDDDRCR